MRAATAHASSKAPIHGATLVRFLCVGNEWFQARPGGMNRYFEGYVDALRGQGVSVVAACIGERGRLRQEVAVGPVGAGLTRRLAGFFRLAFQHRSDVDVLDTHFALYALPFMLVMRYKKHVVHFQGPWAKESSVAGSGRFNTALKRRLESFVYRRADIVVVLSEAFLDVLVADYGVPKANIVVVPPGVDTDFFSPISQRPEDVPRWLEELKGQRIVLSNRRLDPRMGLDVLVNAWSRHKTELVDCVLVVTGDGRERDRLMQFAAGLGVNAIFPGRVSDVELRTCYRLAAVSVVPTRSLEGFGLVVIESLSCGTPVIVTRVGGLPSAVEGLSADLVVEPGDADALGQRLVAALGGQVPSGEQCREWAMRFSWDEVARTHISLLAPGARAQAPR